MNFVKTVHKEDLKLAECCQRKKYCFVTYSMIYFILKQRLFIKLYFYCAYNLFVYSYYCNTFLC